MKIDLSSYDYDKALIKSGIVHIGIGNFHRAHQAYYINSLLSDSTQQDWGITGVCLLPSDQLLVEKLRSQDLDYSLTVCGRNGTDEAFKIGSIIELLWSGEGAEPVISKLADPAIKIISLTITEGGYNIDKQSGEFVLTNESIQHDLQNPDSPSTVFGYVAAGLRKRMNGHGKGVTILCCDNLQHNGNTARKAFLTFIKNQDSKLGNWAEAHVSFPNSMVDRITPATTAQDVKRLNERTNFQDLAPVYCEDFIQWVIEDNFIEGRPALERVGVEFTNDVSAFENMKLSLLNASHTLLSYPAFLKGHRKVDQAMNDKSVVKLVRDFMDIDITPYVPAPGSIDLEDYKQTLVERFANSSVSDQISRLCFDGLSKFPVYIVPNLAKMIVDGQDLSRLAFLIACYRHYLKYQKDDQLNAFDVAEPWMNFADSDLIADSEPVAFLSFSAFKSLELHSVEGFTKQYVDYVERIKNNGCGTVLDEVTSGSINSQH
ncbi:mannitol dehydrogenase family protein [Marinoscillum pacificum]|uniref:mannitol dehydrogenase family protein n=1 Tax=Marinoscillum pacificum TaxID=392723 RepID=UPI0021575A0B|nr:mannitol dehydrogenase family protein [Marinoscillum pacificum]